MTVGGQDVALMQLNFFTLFYLSYLFSTCDDGLSKKFKTTETKVLSVIGHISCFNILLILSIFPEAGFFLYFA